MLKKKLDYEKKISDAFRAIEILEKVVLPELKAVLREERNARKENYKCALKLLNKLDELKKLNERYMTEMNELEKIVAPD